MHFFQTEGLSNTHSTRALRYQADFENERRWLRLDLMTGRVTREHPLWDDDNELLAKYRDLMEGIASLGFLAGFCYTQLTDIEQESNGLLTYDRRPKLTPEAVAFIHRELFRNN